MSRETRGRRAGRIAGLGVLVATALVAAWGVPIDADRVAALVDPDQPVRVRAARARIALRPLPTVVASDVRVAFEDRLRGEIESVGIVLGVRRLLQGEATWSRARVRGGRAVVRTPSGDAPIRCVALGGRVVSAGTTGARLDLHGDCARGGIVLAGVRYRGDVAWRRGEVRSAGRLTSGGLAIADVAGTALSAAVRTGPDGVRADDVLLEIGDGTIAGRGRWLRDSTRRRVALAFAGSGGAAEEAFGDAALRLAGRWVVQGRGRAVAPIEAPLGRGAAGSGRAVVLDGSVEPLDVGGAVLDGLEVWRGRRRRRLARRFPDVFGGERLAFDRAVVEIRGREGRYVLAPIRVRSRSYRADGHGHVGRDGSVRGEIRVVPGGKLADALLGRGALRTIVAGDGDEIVLPLEVAGRPGELRVRPAPAFAREVLERALGGSALGRALDRLLDR